MTDTVAASFTKLVKTNNGLFKSDAQAKFLLSLCDHNSEFRTSGSVYGNSFVLIYVCDQRGVTQVQKQTNAKGLVVQWERAEKGTVAVQDEKEIKRLSRLIKQTEKAMEARLDAFNKGDYRSMELFNMCNAQDTEQLDTLKQMLDAVKNKQGRVV